MKRDELEIPAQVLPGEGAYKVLYPLWEETQDKIPKSERHFFRVKKWLCVGYAWDLEDAKRRYGWIAPVLEPVLKTVHQ